MIDNNVFESIIIQKINDIFNSENFNDLSVYERRKKIYNYLYNTLEFDFEELNNNSRCVEKQIKDVLFNNKGICNSIIYVYKIMLEKVGVYGIPLFCKDEEDIHTIILVDNTDQTLSFDDISIAIYSKQKAGYMMGFEDRFDYDLDDAKLMKQGINEISKNQQYLLIPSHFVNHFFKKDDEYYKTIKPSFLEEETSFTKIANNIRSYKKRKNKSR